MPDDTRQEQNNVFEGPHPWIDRVEIRYDDCWDSHLMNHIINTFTVRHRYHRLNATRHQSSQHGKERFRATSHENRLMEDEENFYLSDAIVVHDAVSDSDVNGVSNVLNLSVYIMARHGKILLYNQGYPRIQKFRRAITVTAIKHLGSR